MNNNKNKDIEAENSSENKDEMEELKIFIKRKKIETKALKKIIAKLNTNENDTNKQ